MQICEFVAEEYQRGGLNIHYGTSPTKFEKTEAGVRVTADRCGDHAVCYTV